MPAPIAVAVEEPQTQLFFEEAAAKFMDASSGTGDVRDPAARVIPGRAPQHQTRLADRVATGAIVGTHMPNIAWADQDDDVAANQRRLGGIGRKIADHGDSHARVCAPITVSTGSTRSRAEREHADSSRSRNAARTADHPAVQRRCVGPTQAWGGFAAHQKIDAAAHGSRSTNSIMAY